MKFPPDHLCLPGLPLIRRLRRYLLGYHGHYIGAYFNSLPPIEHTIGWRNTAQNRAEDC